MFDSQMQVRFTEFFKCVVDISWVLFLLQLKDFNKLVWLVMLNELQVNESSANLLSKARVWFGDHLALSTAFSTLPLSVT